MDHDILSAGQLVSSQDPDSSGFEIGSDESDTELTKINSE